LNSTAIAFSRDGRTLYAAGRDAGHTFVKAIDLAAGSVRDIAQHAGDLTISGGATYQARLSLSPDGRSLATSAVDSRSDLWLLDGYPRPRPLVAHILSVLPALKNPVTPKRVWNCFVIGG
jgi:hypothetical protein